MRAEILSVGTELLLGEIDDTNARFISERLRDVGVFVYRRVTVGDNGARLTSEFKDALGRASLVIATGGLGPTEDDITARCLAAALGRELRFDEETWVLMLEGFKARGRTPSASDRKQAMIVEGGIPLRNATGTAPGQAVILGPEDGGPKMVALLPGPPREMIPMLQELLLPLVSKTFTDLVPVHVRNLWLCGLAESLVGEAVNELMERGNPSLAPYAGGGVIRLRIAATAEDPSHAERMLDEVEEEVRRRLGDHIYGVDDDTLESVVVRLLGRRGLTLAIAESVTGGLLSHKITMVPGSSQVFKLGLVAYSPKVKRTVLDVPSEAIRRDEAVNEETALAMAEGVRCLGGADVGLATTGFAGPGGGTPDVPLGTVLSAIAYKGGHAVDRNVYRGARSAVKELGATRALSTLWRYLKERP